MTHPSFRDALAASTPPGWYVDPRVNRPRYWDGAEWADIGPRATPAPGIATADTWAPEKTRDIDGIPLRPVAALKSAFRNMFTFSGRASRSAFWWFWAWAYAILLIPVAAMIAVLVVVPTADPDIIAGVAGLGMLVLCIPIWIAGLTVAGRRLHDTNQSAALLWLLLIPYIGGLIIFVMLLQRPREPNACAMGLGGAGR